MIGDEIQNVYLLERMLVLTPDQGNSPLKIKCLFHYHPHSSTIDFTTTFHHLARANSQVPHLLKNAQLFFLDERKRTKLFLGEFPLEDSRIYYDDWTASDIIISYRKHEPPLKEACPKSQSKKSRERTIREVRKEIQRWRQVAQQNCSSGSKGITLSGAARSIGMSKKSLDDYLRYLRMGEKLKFDFNSFEGEKIGYLRAFVRSKLRQPEEEAKILNEIDSYWDSTYVSN